MSEGQLIVAVAVPAIVAGLGVMWQYVTRQANRITQLADARMVRVEERLDQVDAHLDRLDSRLDKVLARRASSPA